jgi:hypothetical protein
MMLLGGRLEVLPSMAGLSHWVRTPEILIVSRTMVEIEITIC